MRIFLLIFCSLLFCCNTWGGTLVYKNKKGEIKRVSGLKIVSIDSKKMVVRIANGTETILLSQVQKYYDTDIRISGEFDDDSGEYTVQLGYEKLGSSKKNNGRMELSIPFSISRQKGTSMGARLRQPYFYLFVLSSDAESQNRKMTSYCFPASAKTSMKNYDEAKMLEKVISLDRPYYYQEDTFNRSSYSKRMGGERQAQFTLNAVKNNTVIAWYLVVWGKDSIVATKSWENSEYRISKNWWVR